MAAVAAADMVVASAADMAAVSAADILAAVLAAAIAAAASPARMSQSVVLPVRTWDAATGPAGWGRGHWGHDGFRRGLGAGGLALGLGGLYAYSPGYDYGYCDPTDPNTYIYGYCNGFANGW